MCHLDIFDAQIVAQNIINGADSFPLMAVPFFMLAGEIMNTGGLSKRIVNVALAAGRPRQGRPRLRGDPRRLHPVGAVGLGRRRCRRAVGAARADDGAGRARQGAVGRPDRRVRRHRPGHPAVASASSSSASSADVSITKLFLAGIVPGILIGIALAVAWWWEVRKETIVAAAAQVARARSCARSSRASGR